MRKRRGVVERRGERTGSLEQHSELIAQPDGIFRVQCLGQSDQTVGKGELVPTGSATDVQGSESLCWGARLPLF